jgi:hypothetical protein
MHNPRLLDANKKATKFVEIAVSTCSEGLWLMLPYLII